MNKSPLIGLTGRRKLGSQLVDNLEVLADVHFDMYYSDYARAILSAGGLPVHLPVEQPIAAVVDRLDGLVLTGGADIDPARYNAHRGPAVEAVEPIRDGVEFAILERAIARELPTLGICRGHQLVNVFCGGTLHQHVPAHAAFDHAPTTHWHDVSIEPQSVLNELYGSSRAVNSLHHQTVDQVGPQLRVTACSQDGTVEALEHTLLPIVTVQWHPEMMIGAREDPIFTWLVDQARLSGDQRPIRLGVE